MMTRITLLAVLAQLLVVPATAYGRAETEVEAYERLRETVSRPAIAPSLDGAYQLRRLGKRFLMVFEPNGRPVAILDLSMDQVSLFEMVLGGIGIGDLNVLKLIKVIKQAHQAGREANLSEGQVQREEPTSEREIDRMLDEGRRRARDGEKLFRKIRLTDEWARRNRATKPDRKPGVPIPAGASFTMADLQIDNAEAREKFLVLFAKFINLVDRTRVWDRSSVLEALAEIEIRFAGPGPSYTLVWNRAARLRQAPGQLPDFVVNYFDLGANARYKKGLYQLSNDLSFLNNIGPIGIVIDLVVSQMTAGMVERLEYHEHQLMGLLEAAERFELSGDEFPAPLLTPTLDVLYASTVFLEKDSVERPHYLTSRIQSQISQEKAKTAILAKLEAELPEGDEVTVFGGGKYALVRGQDGRMKSVMSSAIKPHWLFRYVAKHVDGKSMNGKWWERELVTLASFLARALLPESIAFRIGSVPVGITVQPTVYEQIFRLPMTREKYLEGELIGLVDEALAGRLKLPLSQAELEYVRAGLWKSLINPYENLPGTEDGIIQANYEYVESILGR